MATNRGTLNTKIESDLKQRKVNLRDKIFEQYQFSPIYMMLKAKGRTIAETQQKFEWTETRPTTSFFTLENVDNSATTVTVKDAANSNIAAGALIKGLVTGEVMRVTQVSDKTLTVVRGFGTNKVAVTGDTDNKFMFISEAFPEGSTAPQGTFITKGKGFNYSQIFRRTLKVSRNKLMQKEYGDNGVTSEARRKSERNKVLKLLQNDIEKALLVGVPNEDLTGADPLYTTGGVTNFIKTNVMDIKSAGDFKVGTINEMLGKMADSGASGDKVMLAGSGFYAKLNDNVIKTFAGGAGSMLSEYGITMDRVATEYGNLDIMYSQVWSQIFPNSALILDLETILLHEIEDITLKTNIEYDGYDGVVDSFLADCGLEVNNEECNGIIHLNF